MYGHMLNQEVTISAASGTNDYGETSFNAGVARLARVELVNKAKWNPAGQQIVITANVFIDPATPADAGDKVVYNGQSYKVESREEVPDGTGKIRLVTLECIEWRA